MANETVIDGEGAVLGRLASVVAKRLLKGESITIINAEKIIKTGSPEDAKKKALQRRTVGSPQHGPYYPRQPDAMVRRAIRGMLPYKLSRGREAMKRLNVRIGPAGLSGERMAKTLKTTSVTIGEIAYSLRGKG